MKKVSSAFPSIYFVSLLVPSVVSLDYLFMSLWIGRKGLPFLVYLFELNVFID